MTKSINVDEESILKLMFFPDTDRVGVDQVYHLDGTGVLQVTVHSPFCVAPEVLTHRAVTVQGDMWSAAVVLYILLCGFPPFWGSSQPMFDDGHRKLKSRIIDGRFGFPSAYWDGVSDDAKDLVMKMLQTNPEKRLTAEQAMKHKWFGEG